MNSREPQFWDGLYRSRDGWFLGVCEGIARWRNIHVWLIRMLFLFGLLLGFILPVILLYVIAAVVIPPKPVQPFKSEAEGDFYNLYRRSRTMALTQLREKFKDIDKRAQRLESYVTSKSFKWDQELK